MGQQEEKVVVVLAPSLLWWEMLNRTIVVEAELLTVLLSSCHHLSCLLNVRNCYRRLPFSVCFCAVAVVFDVVVCVVW